MALVFWLTFGVIGAGLSDLLRHRQSTGFTGVCDAGLTAFGINPVVHSLVIDGIFAGVGSVLSFLPVIVVLFFFLSILEDSGYMARIAFVMDKLLQKNMAILRQKFCSYAYWLRLFSVPGVNGKPVHLLLTATER